MVRYLVCGRAVTNYAQGKGTGELKNCDENGENYLRMDHFWRDNWSAYNLYGFPVTYFVVVVFQRIMWLAITSLIMKTTNSKLVVEEASEV